MRIGLGQINAVVGDLRGNVERMRGVYAQAAEEGVDLLVFPELAVCGYPPEDLLHKRHFIDENMAAVERLAAECAGEMTIVAGFAGADDGNCYNSAGVLKGGEVGQVYRKGLLPNYGVFDEERYFESGAEPVIVEVKGVRVALTICRDIWDTAWLGEFLGGAGAFDMVLNISASPFHVGKMAQRKDTLGRAARRFGCVVGYCNLVGGQDEIVFDGRSMLVDERGAVVAEAAAFEEDLLVADIEKDAGGKAAIKVLGEGREQPADVIDEIYRALVLGTRDYAGKNGFKRVLLGLSGGVDSSLVACIAAAAVGAENVIGITMPSRFNVAETRSDAQKLAENLGIQFYSIPIEPALEKFDSSLEAVEGWDDKGIAYENLQARIRGTMLMSLSNQFGALVLTSGNKSETAVGYATLYGDTAGGFAVIKDVHKTTVYKLAERINEMAGREVIPETVLTRAPSAELKADQKDTDSLPDYDLLDEILKGYIEEDKSAQELIAGGLDEGRVREVVRLVDRNEYKRRQSPPGIKITAKAFGKDRRMPITNRYDANSRGGL